MQDYVTLLVQGIVGKFKFVEGHWLMHPELASGRGFWMNKHSPQNMWFCPPTGLPPTAIPFVSVIVHGGYVHDQDVLLTGIQPCNPVSTIRKHSPALLCQDHLCVAVVEFVPHAVVFQGDSDAPGDTVSWEAGLDSGFDWS